MDKNLEKFLKDEGLYERVLEICEDQCIPNENVYNSECDLDFLFTWKDTKEGDGYWIDIYEKYCTTTIKQVIPDPTNPSHYTFGNIECIDAITEAIKDLQGIEAFATGNAIKYLWRWKKKNGVEDLKKAKWYIDRMIKEGEQ